MTAAAHAPTMAMAKRKFNRRSQQPPSDDPALTELQEHACRALDQGLQLLGFTTKRHLAHDKTIFIHLPVETTRSRRGLIDAVFAQEGWKSETPAQRAPPIYEVIHIRHNSGGNVTLIINKLGPVAAVAQPS